MKSNFKKEPGSLINLEVELDSKEFSPHWESAYNQALNQVQVKGFRPGTAPQELADKQVDKEKVFEQAAHEAVRASLSETTQEHNWTIIDQPKIEITQVSPQDGLKYKTQLTVFPEVEIGNYKKIAKKILAEKKEIKVESEEIDKALNWLRESRAKLTRVNRGAAKGDVLEVDVKTYVEGKAVPGSELKGDRFVLGEGRFIAGFDDKLANHSEGETLDFSITAGDDYWNKDLRGKPVEFKVKIDGVFARQLPELNDDFARGLGSSFSTLDDVKTSIESGLKAEKGEREQDRIRAKMIDEIAQASKIDVPKILVEKTLDSLIKEVRAVADHGALAAKEEELRRNLEERARERVLRDLVIYKIVQEEKLEPTREEVHAQAQKLNLDVGQHYDYSYGIARNRKLFEFLERQ